MSRLLLIVALCVAFADASSARGGRDRPAVRLDAHRLRGGALWVRKVSNGDDERSLQLVHSLSKFCDEHGLDEDAMRGVVAGEATDHEGWACGELVEYDTQEAGDAGTETDDASDTEPDAQAEEVVEDDASEDPPPPPPMREMLLKMGLPMVANQLLKFADKESSLYIPSLRAAYCGSVATSLVVQILLHWRIASAKSTSMVESAANPLSALLGGSSEPQTVQEYDRSQLKSIRNGMQVGVVMTLVMHFKFKMTQPLIYQAVSSLVELYFHPLVQVHLLGKPTKGALKRPFGSANGGMGEMLKSFGVTPPPALAAEGAGGGDAK